MRNWQQRGVSVKGNNETLLLNQLLWMIVVFLLLFIGQEKSE